MSLHTAPTIHLDPQSDNTHLAALRKERGMVAFLGSAVSIWAPSDLPNGMSITSRLADELAPADAPHSNAAQLIRRSAFEHIMERYPRPQALQTLIARAFYPTIPNPVHKAFAHLINQGIVTHLVTTNYDEGLERACREICSSSRQPQVITTESEAKRARLSEPIIFKIHGCARPGYEKTLVVTLREEGEMPAWKRLLLQQLLDGRNLLICGYSGLDFEICPELSLLSPASLTWNSFYDPSREKEALTPNAHRVLSALNGVVLVGDMCVLLSKLGVPCEAIPSSSPSSFIPDLIEQLDDRELNEWRVGVLNGVGCASAALAVATRLCAEENESAEQMLKASLGLAEAQFHSGLYQQSGATYRQAAAIAQRSGDWEKRLKAELGAVEADRVAGRMIRAIVKITRLANSLPALAPPEIRENVRSALALKQALLRRYPFYLCRVLRLRAIQRAIQRKAAAELSLVAKFSAQRGNWFDFQHCKMLAGKFEIPFAEVYSGATLPPPSQAGYKHLGYLPAELMAVRNALAGVGGEDALAEPVSLKQARTHLKNARKAGITPEIWKLGRAMEKRFGDEALSLETRREVETAWKTCEYTRPMRLLLRIRGEDA